MAAADQQINARRYAIVAGISGDLGQRVLNCFHREWRTAEGILIQRQTRETGACAAKLVAAAISVATSKLVTRRPH
jgi:outer membrane PBP1 activator LpoA protein